MIKILCFMNRKPGLSMEEFKAYYEERHVPLIHRLLPHWIEYRRNFSEERPHNSAHMVETRPRDVEFDVLTELTYENEDMYQRTLAALADPEIGAIIREDEARFLDRETMRVVIVDERRSIPENQD